APLRLCTLPVGCSRLAAPLAGLLRRAAFSSSSARFHVAASDAAESSSPPQQPQQNIRRVALDFNEVRLVGRVSKVLNLSAQWASFLLSTQNQRLVRPAEPGSDQQPQVRQERISHLVIARTAGPGRAAGLADGEFEGGGSAQAGEPDWQQHLYPGSRVEVVGHLANRFVRRPAGDEATNAVDGQQQQQQQPDRPQFEPVIRMTRLAPIANSGVGGSFADQRQPQRQWRQRRDRDSWDDGDDSGEGRRGGSDRSSRSGGRAADDRDPWSEPAEGN
ncbi:hypothetical protein BOX15_Mlig034073g3, partial [Macrostomum lignano]